VADFVAYRLANWDTPLWISPNRRAGRFNKRESPPTQYLCLHPLAPMAEYLRREGYVSLDRLRELRARIWVVRVREPRVTTITFDNALDFGLEAKDLVADDHGACQVFAERCRSEAQMPEVIRVPNAALPGTENLVIFGPRTLAPYLSVPIDQVDVPGSLVAEGAHPLHSLLDHVRYLGEPHPALEAWKRGTAYDLEEPSTALIGTGLQ
jgi:hypothetical protein